MNKRLALIILIVAQLSVPSWMIASQEQVLRQGTLYKFQTRPVDPYDIFRGRYVALSTDQRSTIVENGHKIDRGQIIYAMIEKHSDGFARINKAVLDKPSSGDYIKTKVKYKSGNRVHFSLPFDRYYMNEEKAPEAEALYRRGNRSERKGAYVAVRVLNGTALIEELYIEGRPIGSYF